MDDKGYAFTPLAFLLIIPVLILAVSYSGIVNELGTLSAIVIGGDVTSTVANDMVTAIRQDTSDAGRTSAFLAVQKVINSYNLLPDNNPYFSNVSGSDSKTFVINKTLAMLNNNITNVTRDLENQTGRTISINGVLIDPQGTNTVQIFQSSDLNISQSDPYGFNITVKSVAIKVVQNSTTSGQSVQFNTPAVNVYIPIDQLEDPYIWVNTKARLSLVITKYPYYSSQFSDYHFDDNVSAGKLNYLYDCLVGANTSMGYRPYYFPDPHGLTFFDRLENRTNGSSSGLDSAKMSTFILNDPLMNEHGNSPVSTLDHEYFNSTTGVTINVKGTIFKDPTGRNFLLSTKYIGYLGLQSTYS